MRDFRKLKAIHVHTDCKFIKGTNKFEGTYFENEIIIVRKDDLDNYPCKYADKIFEKEQINEVIQICRNADLVVLYNLNFLKSQIAVALPKDIIIAWRFFGSELYMRMLNEVLSKKTQVYFPGKEFNTVTEALKNIIRPIYHKIKYGGTQDELFYKAIERIDFMLSISIQEYTYLSKFWENLPECVELPVGKGPFKGKLNEPNFGKKKNKIVVGNSRNAFNNHLDLIDLIDKSSRKKQYQFELLFNYGNEGSYSCAVRQAVQGKSYFKLIEEFMSVGEFYTFYVDKRALVVNSYRQLAMGNIFHALKNGVKVYLNNRNIMMEWFASKDIRVFSVEDLHCDLENGNMTLNEDIAYHNLKGLIKLYGNYSKEDFQRVMYNKVISGNA